MPDGQSIAYFIENYSWATFAIAIAIVAGIMYMMWFKDSKCQR